MNGERKKIDANDIGHAKESASGAFKNESNGSMPHVPVPTIHGPWDAMPNVCQGFL